MSDYQQKLLSGLIEDQNFHFKYIKKCLVKQIRTILVVQMSNYSFHLIKIKVTKTITRWAKLDHTRDSLLAKI